MIHYRYGSLKLKLYIYIYEAYACLSLHLSRRRKHTECVYCQYLNFIILRRWPVASYCTEQGEVCFAIKNAYPSLVYVTEGKAPGNAIFIQSVYRMSWGGRTTPSQSSHTIAPSFPRSNHNSYKRATSCSLSSVKKKSQASL